MLGRKGELLVRSGLQKLLLWALPRLRSIATTAPVLTGEAPSTDALSYAGRWWRPVRDDEAPGDPVRGVLTVTANRISAELKEPITGWQPSGPNLIQDLSVRKFPVLHGELDNGLFVTLIDVETSIAVEAAQTLRARYSLLGSFVVDDPRVTRAEIEFDWLDSWIDDDSSYDDTAAPSLRFEVNARRLAEATVEGVGTIAVDSGFDGDVDVRRIAVRRRTHLVVELENACMPEELLRQHVRPLQDLMTLCLGRAVRLTDLRVAVADQSIPSGFTFTCKCPINQAAEPDEAPTPAALQNVGAPTLLSGIDFVRQFGVLIPGWYAARQEYAGAIIKINAPSYARFMYMQNRAAIAVQAVEALHEVKFDSHQLPKADHKERRQAVVDAMQAADLPEEWVAWAGRVISGANNVPIRDQIARILSLTGVFEGKIVRTLPKFVQGAALLRNLSSHGSGTGTQYSSSADVEQAHFLTELVMWALRVAILTLAGVPDVAQTAISRTAVTFAVARLEDLGVMPPKKH